MCDEEFREPLQFRFFEENYVLNFIESLRKEKKITYAAIGRILNCKRNTALRLMRGEIRLDLKRAMILLRYFGYEFVISELTNQCDFPEDYKLDQEALGAEFDIENNPELYKEKDLDKN